MIIIKYISEKELYINKNLFLIKFLNNSYENDLYSISHMIKSLIIYIKRIDYYLNHVKNIYLYKIILINIYLYF